LAPQDIPFFFLLASNGADKLPDIPKQDNDLYLATISQKMIKNIIFSKGEHNYCLPKVICAFRRFFLDVATAEFQFYSATTNSTLKERPDIRSNQFDLKDVKESHFHVVMLTHSTSVWQISVSCHHLWSALKGRWLLGHFLHDNSGDVHNKHENLLCSGAANA
jgi:hypothetical protein